MKNRTMFFSPLTLGFIIAGMLFFVIFAVVRSAISDTGKVEQVAAAGMSSFQQAAGSASSNVSQAVAPQPLPTFGAATEALHSHTEAGAFPDKPQWLESTTDIDGQRWIWADTWLGCLFISTHEIGYYAGDQENYLVWSQLPAIAKRTVKEACHGK